MTDKPRPGQTAYEAWEKAAGASDLPWQRLTEHQRRVWAATEQACLDLDTLPLGDHETEATRLLQLISSARYQGSDVAELSQAATAHAVLGLCDLIRTLIANA